MLSLGSQLGKILIKLCTLPAFPVNIKPHRCAHIFLCHDYISCAGFMLSNKALVVSGAFVGCSGIILTLVMCKSMNRSILNVLVGGFGDGAGISANETKKAMGTAKDVSAEDVISC